MTSNYRYLIVKNQPELNRCGRRRAVRLGQVLSREIETPPRKRWLLRGADAVEIVGRQNWGRRYRETLLDPARSETLCMHVSILSGNREILCLSVEEKTPDRIGKSKDARR